MPAAEHDPLQAQYDGIPVPCYTWRADGQGFILERANRAAFENGRGRLEPLIRGRLRGRDLHAPDIVRDVADTLAAGGRLRREMEYTLLSTGETRLLDVTYVFVPPDRVMVHADDITERRAVEERLRAVIADPRVRPVDRRRRRQCDRRQPGRLPDPRPRPRPDPSGNRDWWRAIAPRPRTGVDGFGQPDSPGRQASRAASLATTFPSTFTRRTGYRWP